MCNLNAWFTAQNITSIDRLTGIIIYFDEFKLVCDLRGVENKHNNTYL